MGPFISVESDFTLKPSHKLEATGLRAGRDASPYPFAYAKRVRET